MKKLIAGTFATLALAAVVAPVAQASISAPSSSVDSYGKS